MKPRNKGDDKDVSDAQVEPIESSEPLLLMDRQEKEIELEGLIDVLKKTKVTESSESISLVPLSLSTLPVELTFIIFLYLRPQDLENIAKTSKDLNTQASDERLWKRLTTRDFVKAGLISEQEFNNPIYQGRNRKSLYQRTSFFLKYLNDPGKLKKPIASGLEIPIGGFGALGTGASGLSAGGCFLAGSLGGGVICAIASLALCLGTTATIRRIKNQDAKANENYEKKLKHIAEAAVEPVENRYKLNKK